MTSPLADPAPARIPPGAARRAARIHAIAVGLAAAGVAAHTNGNDLTGLDVTATSQLPGRATAEVMLDEDGYAEIRWYTNPAAPPQDITAALAKILAAVSATPAVLAPTPRPAPDCP